MAKKVPLYLCYDRPIAFEHKVDAAKLAIGENTFNEPPPLTLQPGASFHPMKMALFTGKMWDPKGRTLGVRFLDGTKKQRAQTQKYATVWSNFANITFNFKAGANAEIRVSFAADPGSWSACGTDCLLRNAFPKNEATMNFGWLRDDSAETEWRRVVTHEFGHALGAIHEHQNPKGGIQWNLPAVYRAFQGPPNNWSKADVDFNIVQKYSADQLNATNYDSASIMLYSFPPELVLNHVATPNNTDLSAMDKQFIAEKYPKKGVAKPKDVSAIAAAGEPRLSIAAPSAPRFATFAGVAGLQPATVQRGRAR
ncbi:MAG: hypothetical protein JWO56_2952 [Acidobacteria bacterium]|nr:hypothetical protein [Acidobacteriota bacterium]